MEIKSTHSSSLKPENRIKKSADFLTLLRTKSSNSFRSYSDWFEVKAVLVPNSDKVRFGFTVGKKFAHHSVDRNLIKRILRESARHHAVELTQQLINLQCGLDVSLRLNRKLINDGCDESFKAFKRKLRDDSDQLLKNLSHRLTVHTNKQRKC